MSRIHAQAMNTLRVAALQMCSRQDRRENLAQAQSLLEAAVRRGARLVALPENFSFLDREGRKLDMVEDPEHGPSIRLLRDFARENHVTIVGGSVPLRAGNRITNTCLVFGPDGSILARYDKIHLFDIFLDAAHNFRESRHIVPGSELVTFEAYEQCMGLGICYDLRFPELFRRLTMRGAKVLFVPSAFTWRTGTYHWTALLRARAIENLCYVVAPAQQGQHNADRESFGHTMIIDPWGQILAQAPDHPTLVVADLDFAYQDRLRQKLPCLNHAQVLGEKLRNGC